MSTPTLHQLALDALGQSGGNTHEAIVAIDNRIQGDRKLFNAIAHPLIRQAVRQAVAGAIQEYREKERAK